MLNGILLLYVLTSCQMLVLCFCLQVEEFLCSEAVSLAVPAPLPPPAACLCLPGLPSAFPIFLFLPGLGQSPCSCPLVPCPESLLLRPPQRFVFLPVPPERGRATRQPRCPKHQGGRACPASAQLLVHRANVCAHLLQGTLH